MFFIIILIINDFNYFDSLSNQQCCWGQGEGQHYLKKRYTITGLSIPQFIVFIVFYNGFFVFETSPACLTYCKSIIKHNEKHELLVCSNNVCWSVFL